VRNRLKNPQILISGIIFVLIVGACALAPLIAPYNPLTQNIENSLAAPSWAHWMGTDLYGRDTLSRVLYGGQPTLAIAFGTVLFAGVAGTLVGLFAALAGPRTDTVTMRIAEFGLVLPPLLLAIAVVAVLGTSSTNVVIALAIVFMPIFARVSRAASLTERSSPYIEAAVMGGESKSRIAFQQILPNIAGPVVVQLLLVFTYAILAEASLSFLGLGTQPPLPSWGRMLSESAGYLTSAPWLAIFPGVTILVTVIALNILGDSLASDLDPRQRRLIETSGE
jgi:peptide/nickel transport system permease protein